MVNKGDCLKVKTTTKDDVFGTCYYEVVEVGLPSPEKGRKENDGIKCVMLGGTGPSAWAGRIVHDSQMKVGMEIANGTTEVLSKQSAMGILNGGLKKRIDKNAPGEGVRRPSTGCVEMG